jgi:signal transduction histidine kinase
LLNFLSNSLKFTDPGGEIKVKIEILSSQTADQSDDKKRYKQTIKDHLHRVESVYDLNEVMQENVPQVVPSSTSFLDMEKQYIDLRITVSDNGVGISPDGIEKLFIDFGKLEDTNGRNVSGTGLGLSICKQIIEQMGGSVSVKSNVGEGTDFIINIKTKCQPKTPLFELEYD